MITPGSVSGHFNIKVYDANTGALTKERDFDNLITNQGLAWFCGANGSTPWNRVYACVGNGTNTPSVDDTALGAHLRNSNTYLKDSWGGTVTAPTAPDWITSVSGTVRFNAGVFDGTNITEVGITNGSSGNPIWCRALILDEQGQPSSITVLANEYLDVKYTLSYHPKLTDTEFQFTMNNVTYDCIARAANVATAAFGLLSPLNRFGFGFRYAYNTQTLGEITGEPVYESGGRVTLNGDNSLLAYSSAEPYTYKSSVNLSLSQANFTGGIGAVLVGNSSTQANNGLHPRTQISFSPKLPKDANTEMSFTLARTMSRYVAPTP